MATRIFKAEHFSNGDEHMAKEGNGQDEKSGGDGRINPLFRAPIDFVRDQVPIYLRVSRQAMAGHRSIDSADHCETLFRQLRSTCDSKAALDDFFAWATDRALAFNHAEKAIAVDPLDLYARRLLSWGHG